MASVDLLPAGVATQIARDHTRSYRLGLKLWGSPGGLAMFQATGGQRVNGPRLRTLGAIL